MGGAWLLPGPIRPLPAGLFQLQSLFFIDGKPAFRGVANAVEKLTGQQVPARFASGGG